MEPFSTSVFKVLTWIFATTTKICTDDSSISSYELTSTLIVATPLLAAIRRLRYKTLISIVSERVWAKRSSAIHFQG
jgi:hypothetical protein